MTPLYHDILQQPQTLRKLADFYGQGEGAARLSSVPTAVAPVLTGMGASFHAAWVAALHLRSLGVSALIVEATDLLYYDSVSLLRENGLLVYVSQSGASAEVVPIIECLSEGIVLLAVTNDLQSPLARHAHVILPLLAGTERSVATKTYVNSLATLWLLARRWGGALDGSESETLAVVAEEIEKLLEKADSVSARWLDVLGEVDTLLFVGHGPHAATARQVALTVSEWTKVPAMSASVGAFQHGFIEITQPGLGVVVFAAPGRTYTSVCAMARELSEYGARVLLVENGRTRNIAETVDERFALDEFLSPILDVIPAQLFAEALAQHLGITPGFCYISPKS